MAAVNIDAEITSWSVSGGKWGYIDTSGKMVIAPQFDEAFVFSKKGYAIVRENGYMGVVDKTGKLIIPPQYDKIEDFSEGIAAFEKDGKWGYIKDDGTVISQPKYDETSGDGGSYYIGSFSNGITDIKIGDKSGYLNSAGKEIWIPSN